MRYWCYSRNRQICLCTFMYILYTLPEYICVYLYMIRYTQTKFYRQTYTCMYMNACSSFSVERGLFCKRAS